MFFLLLFTVPIGCNWDDSAPSWTWDEEIHLTGKAARADLARQQRPSPDRWDMPGWLVTIICYHGHFFNKKMVDLLSIDALIWMDINGSSHLMINGLWFRRFWFQQKWGWSQESCGCDVMGFWWEYGWGSLWNTKFWENLPGTMFTLR